MATQPSKIIHLPGLTDAHRAELKAAKINTIKQLRNSDLFINMPAITKAYTLYQPVELNPTDAKKITTAIITICRNIPDSHTEVVGSVARCNAMLDKNEPPICPPGITSYEAGKRSCCEMAGDIDILTTAPLSVVSKRLSTAGFEILTTYSNGTKRRSSIVRYPSVSADPIKLDLFHTTPGEFAFAKLHYTIGREANIALRNKAKTLGFKLNQSGLENMKTGEKLPFDNHKKIEEFIKAEYKKQK